jgi:hypothetical protein
MTQGSNNSTARPKNRLIPRIAFLKKVQRFVIPEIPHHNLDTPCDERLIKEDESTIENSGFCKV